MEQYSDRVQEISFYISGSIYLVCSITMLVSASLEMEKIRARKSFIFLKYQITLVIIFALTVFFNGLFLLRIQQFDFWCPTEKWYKLMFGIILEYAAGLSLSWLFWNLTY